MRPEVLIGHRRRCRLTVTNKCWWRWESLMGQLTPSRTLQKNSQHVRLSVQYLRFADCLWRQYHSLSLQQSNYRRYHEFSSERDRSVQLERKRKSLLVRFYRCHLWWGKVNELRLNKLWDSLNRVWWRKEEEEKKKTAKKWKCTSVFRVLLKQMPHEK